ncbi:NtaA/DmoA family FMN-dependent monooxygenase [Cryobacterium arcticum]|uniref:FMNH2-dependent monooxygenase n=1 Tax=Cryobacterium arcticum TaxID=670052 RepID=A0A318A4C5_9MICO|nr:NtaA/DmoA family FMN-dependent monooxygenase [Cryobacterium arcticum]PXA73229.1 FMNH2-dependent monooxygenase [Cryobacterium arcticum]
MVNPFHLGWFMSGSTAQGWASPWSGDIASTWGSGAFHVRAAQLLERAKLDFILWEDLYYIPHHWQGKTDIYVENAISTPRLDTLTMTTFVAAQTSKIGLIATVPNFAYHPYALARLFSSIDSLSGGRAGWNVVTGTTNQALRNFGHEGLGETEDRYEKAGEYVDLMKAIWNTWEEDAIIADESTGRFADPAKVHKLKFEGKHYSFDGSPLVSGRSPQGIPAIAQAGASAPGRRLAAAHSDVIVGVAQSVAGMKQYREDVRNTMIELGRDPDDCKVLFLITPMLADTQEEAELKRANVHRQAEERVEIELADIGKRMDIDLSVLPMDTPLTEELLAGLHTTGHISYLAKFVKSAGGRTLREMAVESYIRMNWSEIDLYGTVETVADRMEEIMAEVGGDGFLFSQGNGNHTTRYMVEVAEGLVPELQRRGLARREYTSSTLKGHLQEF